MAVADQTHDEEELTDEELRDLSGSEAYEHATEEARDLADSINETHDVDNRKTAIVAPSTDDERVVLFDEAINPEAIEVVAQSSFDSFTRARDSDVGPLLTVYQERPDYI